MVSLPMPSIVVGKKAEELIKVGGLPFVPEGDYKVICVNSELRKIKDNDNLLYQFEIAAGQYKGTKLELLLSLWDARASYQSAAISKFATMATIAKVEMAQLYGESALAHGKLMLACVKNSQGKPWINADGEQVEGKPFSKITGIKPLPADGVVTAPQKTTTVMKPAPKKEVAAQPDDFDL